MSAIDKSKIINALFQHEENIHEIIRQLNAYDASSLLIAESNWMKRNHFNKYMPKETASKKISFGQVCTIDYGKTYKGEVGYIHPGLCVGKRKHKYLVIPMTSGKMWRNTCYHPMLNPEMTKDKRQSCITEGFRKEGVLLMNDARFISGGRILELHEIINDNTLKEIQTQLLYIMFPNLYKEFDILSKQNIQLQNTIDNLTKQIKNLKLDNEKMSKKIHNHN